MREACHAAAKARGSVEFRVEMPTLTLAGSSPVRPANRVSFNYENVWQRQSVAVVVVNDQSLQINFKKWVGGTDKFLVYCQGLW